MIKKIFLAVAVAFSIGFAAQAQKFATVSADEIMAAMPEMTEIQKKVEEASKQYESEYSKLKEEFDKKFAEYQELEKDATTPAGHQRAACRSFRSWTARASNFSRLPSKIFSASSFSSSSPCSRK